LGASRRASAAQRSWRPWRAWREQWIGDRKEEGQPVFARRRRGAERLSQGGGAGGFLGGEFQHSIFNKKYSMGNGILYLLQHFRSAQRSGFAKRLREARHLGASARRGTSLCCVPAWAGRRKSGTSTPWKTFSTPWKTHGGERPAAMTSQNVLRVSAPLRENGSGIGINEEEQPIFAQRRRGAEELSPSHAAGRKRGGKTDRIGKRIGIRPRMPSAAHG
jgi:hypothetical protein